MDLSHETLELHKRITDSGCWEWTGSINSHGYGTVSIQGVVHGVHRVSASLYLGFDLRSELHVCHKCDNPPCWNPEHLFVGTQSDNSRDMIVKGRRGIYINPGKLSFGPNIRCRRGHSLESKDSYYLSPQNYKTCKQCMKDKYDGKKK